MAPVCIAQRTLRKCSALSKKTAAAACITVSTGLQQQVGPVTLARKGVDIWPAINDVH